MSLIIHYTGVQQIVDCKRVWKTPSHFMLLAMAPHGKEMSQDLQEDQQRFTLSQSEYCSKNLKKLELQPSHRDVQVVYGN